MEPFVEMRKRGEALKETYNEERHLMRAVAQVGLDGTPEEINTCFMSETNFGNGNIEFVREIEKLGGASENCRKRLARQQSDEHGQNNMKTD